MIKNSTSYSRDAAQLPVHATGETISKGRYDDLVDKFQLLEKEHHATCRHLRKADQRLRENEQELQEKTQRLYRAQEKLREAKRITKEWQRWYDNHPKKRGLDTHRDIQPATEANNGEGKTPVDGIVPKSGQARFTKDEVEKHTEDSAEKVVEYELPTISRLSSTVSEPTVLMVDPPIRSSSQSTQLDPEPSPIANLEPVGHHDEDDDVPVVVSERTIRRRKPCQRQYVSTGSARRGSASQPLIIKREETDTSDVIHDDQALPPMLVPYSSTAFNDLDELPRRIATPRKRQRHSYDGPDELVDNDIAPLTVIRSKVLQAGPHLANDPMLPQSSQIVPEESRSANEATDSPQSQRSSGPLLRLDPNIVVLPRVSPNTVSTVKKRRNSVRHLESKLVDLGEDNSQPKQPTTEPPNKKARLVSLLQDGNSPANKSIITPRGKSFEGNARKETISPVEENTVIRKEQITRKGIHAKKPTVQTSRTTGPQFRKVKPPSINDDYMDTRPEEEPLRSRSIHALAMDDFIINPRFVGSDYAFNAVVRAQDARRCLPGCTGPCCAALLEFAAATERGRTRTTGSDLADDKRIRDYLGRDQSPSALTSSQRQHLLISLRERDFVDKYSRHRLVFERRKSPPGFWRTDMPSTQDLEMLRAETKKAERRDVADRWTEAMRGDGKGRWIFRDEA